MKAYRIATGKRIFPFNDPSADCLIGNRRLDDLQKETLQALSLELVDSGAAPVPDTGEHLVFTDSLFFSAELLKEFIEKSRQLKTGAVCALKPGLTTIRTVVTTQDVRAYPDRIEYNLHYVPAGWQGNPVPVIIETDQQFESIPMPDHMFGSSDYRIPLTDRLILQIDHWTNLWSANIAFLLAEGARANKAPVLKQLGWALKARSTNKWKVLRQLNRIGKNCDIHPTAYIEFSTLGDNVTVGAGAVIRESILGNNAYVGNNAVIELSVLGEKAHIMAGGLATYSVLYPGVLTDGCVLEACLCGRDSFVGGALLTDFRFDGKTVTVMKGDTKIDTGDHVLGSCLGHGVYIGAGSVVAPGRTIPNNIRLSPEESRVVRGCDDADVPGYRKVVKKSEN